MKELFLKNWLLKIVSIASALLLWFVVVGLQNAPQQFETPLEIKPFNLSEQYTVVGSLPHAKVKILVDKEAQRQIRPEDFDAYIDLKNTEPGKVTSTVYVTSKNPKVTIVSVSPGSVTVAIEKTAEKQMVVEYEISGKVRDGSQLKGVKVDPQKVQLSGATSSINALKKIKAVIILNGTENHTFTGNHLSLVDQDGKPLQGIKVTPDSVDATVEIDAMQQEKIVPIKPRLSGTLKSGFLSKITVHPNVINLQANSKILESISGLETDLIDLDKITKTGSYPVNIILPKDAHASSGTKVDVYLEISEAQ
ncbi:MAG: CdaR family protein [Candidatus Gracilibacteria bacterium]